MARKRKEEPKEPRKRRGLRRLSLVLGAVGLGLVVVLGTRWTSSIRCERVDLVGVQHADSAEVLELAQVDTSLALFDIEVAFVADRVQRHPWVRAARVMRFPTGTLQIVVEERTPAVIALDREGRPAHYLDREGFFMPLAPGAAYDVPLLRGLREPYHPVQPVQDEGLRSLLSAVATLDEETDALVSELAIQPGGEVVLQTIALDARGSIPVRLGQDGFAEKLNRLRTFWNRAVLTQPEKTFRVIDLRFDGQIVTREEAASGPP